MMSSSVPVVRRLPSEGGTEEILSTSDGGAMGTMVGTPETKYGGKVGDCGVEVPDFMRLPASYTARQKRDMTSKRRRAKSTELNTEMLQQHRSCHNDVTTISLRTLLRTLVGQISELIVAQQSEKF